MKSDLNRKRIHFFSMAILALLLFQFAMGMAVNLFVTFPTSGTPGLTDSYLIAAFEATGPLFDIHWLNGGVLFALSISVSGFSLRIPETRFRVVALLGMLTVAISGLFGLLFIASGFEDDVFSYIMAIGFITGFSLYFELLYSSFPSQASNYPT